MKKKVNRVVLAYSGGLDTSVILGWLIDEGYDVDAVYVDLGLDAETTARTCAITVYAITTLYVLLGGLYGVVVTNVIQTVILTAAGMLSSVYGRIQ